MTTPHEDQAPDDETLVAYADGALPEDETARVERYLAANEDARRLVEQLRASAKLATEAFDDILKAAPPKALVDKILAGPAANAGNIVSITKASLKRRPAWSAAVAMAASIALLAAAAGIYRFMSQPSGPATGIAAGPVAAGSQLAGLLETKASGEAIAINRDGAGDGTDLIAVATFRDRDGRFCREVEATDKEARAITFAIACRSPAEGWTVVGIAKSPESAGSTGPEFNPAAGATGSPIDDILSQIGAGQPLPLDEEKAALMRHWKN